MEEISLYEMMVGDDVKRLLERMNGVNVRLSEEELREYFRMKEVKDEV